MKHIQQIFSYPQWRDTYFDNIKGKLIVLVVLGHLLEFKLSYLPIRFIYVFLYSFVMPTFCFVSGVFFSPKLKNIIKIFFIYFLSQVILFSFKHELANISFYCFLTPIWTLWYLFCLFYWYCICSFFKKIPKSFVLLFALILSLLCGFLKIGYFLSLQRACSFFFFFALGLYIGKENIKNQVVKLQKWKCFLVCISALLVLFSIYRDTFFPMAFYNSFSYYSFAPYSEWNMFGVRCLQFILSFIFGIFLFKNNSNNKGFYTWCGYYSLYIYLIHTFVLYYFK